MHVLKLIPYSSNQAFPGHKGYIVSSSCWILVPRHLVFLPRNPFHECHVEVVRTSPRDTKVGALLQVPNSFTRGVAKIGVSQQMENSVREEGANLLPHSAFENRTYVSSVETRTPQERDTAGLTLFIGVGAKVMAFPDRSIPMTSNPRSRKYSESRPYPHPQSTISTRSDLRGLLSKIALASILAAGLGENPHNPYPRSS
jgi:hypothetical protein